MRVVYLDFETYYDSDYTLKKLSIEAYVRDPRFEAHLLGLAIDNGQVYMMDAKDIGPTLKVLALDDPSTLTVAQNAKFDIFIAEQIYGVRVLNPVCTRAMMRWTGASRLTRESLEAQCEFFGTGTKGGFIHNMQGRRIDDLTPYELSMYKAYCTGDVAQLRDNFKAMLPYMTRDALKFIIMTTRMYTQPVLALNEPMLLDYYASLQQAHEESQTKLRHLFQFDSNEAFLKALRSKTSFCRMLEQLGGEVPYKLSEKRTATRRRMMETRLAELDAKIPGVPFGDPAKEALIEEQRTVRNMLEGEEYRVYEPALAKKDLEFVALMEHENPDIAALATARAENNSSIAMSRTSTFLSIARRGLLPVPLEPFLANTGRYTGGSQDPDAKSDGVNLQNLSKHTGDKTLRRSIYAQPGYTLVACDSSQVEARVGAWICRQESLLQDFRQGADPYCRMASMAYPYSYEEIYHWAKGPGSHEDGHDELKKKHKFHRQVGKTMLLQLQYGAGAEKFALYLSQNGVQLHDGEDTSTDAHHREARRLVRIYRQSYRQIAEFWDKCNDVITALVNGFAGSFGGPENSTFVYDGNHQVFGRRVPGIMLPDGYWILYPNLRTATNEEKNRLEFVYDIMHKGKMITKRLFGSSCYNNICQGLAFAIMRWQALGIDSQFPVRLNVHDEWLVATPDERLGEAMACVTHWMRQLPDWATGIPIDCEASYGKTYADV